ncbi:MAG: hypothetical protein WCR30_03310 [Clostridia bacterium]
MLTKIEKKLMLLSDKLCGEKSKALIPFSCFAELFTNKNGVFDENLMQNTFLTLFKQDLIDATITKGKNEKYVFVEILKKGKNFNADIKREKRRVFLIVVRTILLAVLSFAVTIILKKIFSGKIF